MPGRNESHNTGTVARSRRESVEETQVADNDKRRTLLLNILASVGIVICGVLIGGTARMVLFPPEEDSGDSAVSEVVKADGTKLTSLAYQPAKGDAQAQALEALQAYRIEAVKHAGKIMVRPDEADLALDCLSALGMVPGTEHFSLVDVKANPKTQPLRHEFQQRLAVQNMLSKMLTTMSAVVLDAKVQYIPKGRQNGGVKVTLKLKPGAKLEAAERSEMLHNIAELSPGVSADEVVLVDDNGQPLR